MGESVNSAEILSEVNIYNKYAKYIPHLSRRENWREICERYEDMLINKYPQLESDITHAVSLVEQKKILPSMRMLQFAGTPIEINNVRGYNCSAVLIDDYRAFSEVCFALLSGTGVGFSVQKSHVDKLPSIRKPLKTKRFLIADSIEGWADAVHHLMKAYFRSGARPVFDYRDIRPKGARLVTSGGKAPGHEPLKNMLESIEAILSSKSDGEKIRPIEAHDIVCLIADAVRAGGVRRSATISLFSLDDELLINSKSNFTIEKWAFVEAEGAIDEYGQPKSMIQMHTNEQGEKFYDIDVTYIDEAYGERKSRLYWVTEENMTLLKSESKLPWYYFHPHRGCANNSVLLLRSRLTKDVMYNLIDRIEKSKAGEPGIFLSSDKNIITNPCGEISIKCTPSGSSGSGGGGFCNLCEINVSNIVSQEDYNERAKYASFLGTLQASFTDFHFLREGWKKNVEKEALIGVSMTGIADGEVLNYNMEEAAKIVVEENKRVAEIIGINPAYRTTTVKPSGSSSIVLGSSSGIHARHSKYYWRRMRLAKNEALYAYLAVNAPEILEDDILDSKTSIIKVAIKSPDHSVTREETALDMLERIKKVYSSWIVSGHVKGANTHNVSATVSVKDDEWEGIKKWMWENRDYYNGITLLNFNGGTYPQMPYEECSEEDYLKHIKILENISINLDDVIEHADNTDVSGEVACGGNGCEIK